MVIKLFLQKLKNTDKEKQVEYRAKYSNIEQCECIWGPIPVKEFQKHVRCMMI